MEFKDTWRNNLGKEVDDKRKSTLQIAGLSNDGKVDDPIDALLRQTTLQSRHDTTIYRKHLNDYSLNDLSIDSSKPSESSIELVSLSEDMSQSANSVSTSRQMLIKNLSESIYDFESQSYQSQEEEQTS